MAFCPILRFDLASPNWRVGSYNPMRRPLSLFRWVRTQGENGHPGTKTALAYEHAPQLDGDSFLYVMLILSRDSPGQRESWVVPIYTAAYQRSSVQQFAGARPLKPSGSNGVSQRIGNEKGYINCGTLRPFSRIDRVF